MPRSSSSSPTRLAPALRRFKAEFFQALAHPTRVHIVELLRDGGELSAGTILDRLEVEQANSSQHLAVLRHKGIVVSRREGNQVFYSLRDSVIVEVLDTLKIYFHAHLSEVSNLLCEIEAAEEAQ
jgi:ArsR family transcriptional regulator